MYEDAGCNNPCGEEPMGCPACLAGGRQDECWEADMYDEDRDWDLYPDTESEDLSGEFPFTPEVREWCEEQANEFPEYLDTPMAEWYADE